VTNFAVLAVFLLILIHIKKSSPDRC